MTANSYAGEVPLPVELSGTSPFVCYETAAIGRIQTALGFTRPDPLAPALVIEEDEVDGAGIVTRRKVLLDAGERQRRMIDAFDALFLRPDPEALMRMLRIGLGRWERKVGKRVTDDEWTDLCNRIGLVGLNLIHGQALVSGTYLGGTEAAKGEADPNAPSAVQASMTSTTS